MLKSPASSSSSSNSTSSSSPILRVGQTICGGLYRTMQAFDRAFLRHRGSHLVDAHLGKLIFLSLAILLLAFALLRSALSRIGVFLVCCSIVLAAANVVFLQLVPEFMKAERVAIIRAKKLVLVFFVSILLLFPMLASMSHVFFGTTAFKAHTGLSTIAHSSRGTIEFVRTPPTNAGGIVASDLDENADNKEYVIVGREELKAAVEGGADGEPAVSDPTPAEAEIAGGAPTPAGHPAKLTEHEPSEKLHVDHPIGEARIGGPLDDSTKSPAIEATKQPLDASIVGFENESQHWAHDDKKPLEAAVVGYETEDQHESEHVKKPLEGSVVGYETEEQHLSEHSKLPLEASVVGYETDEQHKSEHGKQPLEGSVVGFETEEQHQTEHGKRPLEGSVVGFENDEQHALHGDAEVPLDSSYIAQPLEATIVGYESTSQHDAHTKHPLEGSVVGFENEEQHQEHDKKKPLEGGILGYENRRQHRAHALPPPASLASQIEGSPDEPERLSASVEGGAKIRAGTKPARVETREAMIMPSGDNQIHHASLAGQIEAADNHEADQVEPLEAALVGGAKFQAGTKPKSDSRIAGIRGGAQAADEPAHEEVDNSVEAGIIGSVPTNRNEPIELGAAVNGGAPGKESLAAQVLGGAATPSETTTTTNEAAATSSSDPVSHQFSTEPIDSRHATSTRQSKKRRYAKKKTEKRQNKPGVTRSTTDHTAARAEVKRTRKRAPKSGEQ